VLQVDGQVRPDDRIGIVTATVGNGVDELGVLVQCAQFHLAHRGGLTPQMRRGAHAVGRFQLQQNLLQGGVVDGIHGRHVQPGDRVAGSRSSSNRIA
jgi:hypothetical protein